MRHGRKTSADSDADYFDGIDAKAKMNVIPSDYVTKLKEKYRANGFRPSNTQYGWIFD